MNSAGSKLEFFIDPPAVGPNAPDGGWVRIERTNTYKKGNRRKKIIRLSRADVLMLQNVLVQYWSKELAGELIKHQLSVDNSNSAG